MKDITIEKAQRSEAPKVLEFINQLADFERLRKNVKATVEDIEKNIFENNHADVVFLKLKGKPIGFAVYFYQFSTFLAKPTLYLEDLFIQEKYRRRGYGKTVLKYLAKTAIENDCGRFEWHCLEWNQTSIDFYENLGARPLHGWTNFRMDGKDLEKLAME